MIGRVTIETMNPTIRGKAQFFGVDPFLIHAVYQAEGGTESTLIRAVQCSIPSVSTFEKAVEVVCRSAVHALCDFVRAGGEPLQDAFVASWASRWAPPGAANDPGGLNAHWASNVDRLWTPASEVHL